MSEQAKATQLSFVRAKSAEELTLLIRQLPFRIEIKGGPIKDGTNWIVFFVPPEHIAAKGGVPNIDASGV